ncbi:peroxiredoxin-like family protein [uncultured Sphingomonas sp.]|uniref:peroxiredoxin-like family protein n=1 Tax=uncultured Sphingomonas sp. TaxID=158754 RepID=UPI0035C9AAF5
MSDRADTLKTAFHDLDAERARAWPAAQFAANVMQRRTLVERFDPSRAVQVGDRLDGVTFVAPGGAPLSLDTLVADGLAVLIFFRFATCPADAIALPHYDRFLRPALERAGIPLVAISPQLPERLTATVEAHALKLTVASDPGNRLAEQLGITFAPDRTPSPPPADWIGAVTGTGTWDLPMPTVLIVDRTRVVRFVVISPDWLDCPDASAILQAVNAVRADRISIGARDAA